MGEPVASPAVRARLGQKGTETMSGVDGRGAWFQGGSRPVEAL